MSERSEHLHASADEQLGALIDVISAADESALRRPCRGREKLGDGSVGAVAAHTAENYDRIASFVGSAPAPAGHAGEERRGRGRPRWLRTVGHRPPAHRRDLHGDGERYTADSATPSELTARLATVRASLARIAELTDEQLKAVPPKDSFRFCDGERNVEEVLSALLRHQEHQVQTVKAALMRSPA